MHPIRKHQNAWRKTLEEKQWEMNNLTVLVGFPGGSAGKESTCNAGDMGSIPGLGRSSGKGNGYPLQYSGLENSMDCIVHGVTESDTTEWLSLSGNFRTYLSIINKTTRQDINKEIEDFNKTINQIDLTDIYGTHHPTVAEYSSRIHSLQAYMEHFSRIEHMLGNNIHILNE